MDSKRWAVGSLIGLLACACGGRAEGGDAQDDTDSTAGTGPRLPTVNNSGTGGKTSTGVGSLQPASNGSNRPSAATSPPASSPAINTPAPTDCVDAQCPSISYVGTTVSGCCQGSGACGARVPLGTSTLCLAPDADTLVGAVNAAFAGVKPEAITLDPSCPGLSIASTPLPGCCDPQGVCGVSTKGWSSAAAALGLKIPSSCLTPSEASGLPGFPVATSSGNTSCGARPR